MPTYEYRCEPCSINYEINKSFKDAERLEPCSKCGEDLIRIISPVNSNLAVCRFEPHFNYAFGEVMTRPADIKDAVIKHEDKTGQKLIEVGSEKTDSMKENKKSFTLTEGDLQKANEILREYR